VSRTDRKNDLKITISPKLESDLQNAIQTFINISPLQISTPRLTEHTLTAHPVDLVEILKMAEVRPDNELEFFRFKKTVRTEVSKKLARLRSKASCEVYQLALECL